MHEVKVAGVKYAIREEGRKKGQVNLAERWMGKKTMIVMFREKEKNT